MIYITTTITVLNLVSHSISLVLAGDSLHHLNYNNYEAEHQRGKFERDLNNQWDKYGINSNWDKYSGDKHDTRNEWRSGTNLADNLNEHDVDKFTTVDENHWINGALHAAHLNNNAREKLLAEKVAKSANDVDSKQKFAYFVQGNGPDGFYSKGVFGTNDFEHETEKVHEEHAARNKAHKKLYEINDSNSASEHTINSLDDIHSPCQAEHALQQKGENLLERHAGARWRHANGHWKNVNNTNNGWHNGAIYNSNNTSS